MVYKQVSYGITMIGEPEVIYKIRNCDRFWHALADAEALGTVKVHINWVKEQE